MIIGEALRIGDPNFLLLLVSASKPAGPEPVLISERYGNRRSVFPKAGIIRSGSPE